MDTPPDEIDEVALNVLLAQGVDFPTAIEASRRNPDGAADIHGCLCAAVIVAAATGAAFLCL
jgi:hypothetical protein